MKRTPPTPRNGGAISENTNNQGVENECTESCAAWRSVLRALPAHVPWAIEYPLTGDDLSLRTQQEIDHLRHVAASQADAAEQDDEGCQDEQQINHGLFLHSWPLSGRA